MRILFTRFPLESIPNGGAEQQVINLALGLRDRGHAVAFAGSCTALTPAFREEHLPVVDQAIGPPPVTKRSAVTFAFRKRSAHAALERMLQDFKALDVIIMLSLTEKLLLTEIAATRGITVIWIEHDPVGRWLTRNPWLKRLRQQSAYATTVTVSALSRVQYLEMDWDPKRTVAIPNGIGDAWFQKEGKKKDRPAGAQLHLGYVGRLAEEKGVDLLLRALADLPHTTLDIAGDGPAEAALRAQAHRLGLDHRVRFLGRVTDVRHVYSIIDALVLPSRTIDPFGMVVAEAMACGVPCLVTDACGISGYLKHEHDALIVKAESSQALRDGIHRFHNGISPAAMGKQGKQTAATLFTVPRMVDEYEKIFKIS